MDGLEQTEAASAGLETGLAPQWPMTVDAFLSGPYLQRSDVVLTRTHRDFRSWLIRWATKGSFSHAALVFLVPHQEKGFNNSFVIESTSKGVDLANLADYLNDRRSVVGIKRVNNGWFQNDAQSLVRGRMLNSIESKYSYATIASLGWNFFSELAFGVRSRISGTRKAIRGRRDQALQPPNEFICSGLVQLGFVNAIAEQDAAGSLQPSNIADVVFRDDLARFLPANWADFSAEDQMEMMWMFVDAFGEDLEASTPEDLAATAKLDWVYIIRGGEVHPVTSDEQARELLNWRPRRKKS